MPITFKYYFIFIRDLRTIGIWFPVILGEGYNDDIIQKQMPEEQMLPHQSTTCKSQLKVQV